MFLRRFERHKNGKPHTYWALAESYRTAKGSRQRIVAYLGELTPAEQDGWAKLGQHLATKSGDEFARRESAGGRIVQCQICGQAAATDALRSASARRTTGR